jgi:hypothetical protein
MRNALRWQLYITAYTFLFGAPLLTWPNRALPLLGFPETGEPWVRMVGMFMLAMSYVSLVIYLKKLSDLIIHTIVIRSGFIVVLTALAVSGYSPVFYLLAGIVAVGVIGSSASYFPARPSARGHRQ